MWVKGRVWNLREPGKLPFPKGGGAVSPARKAGYSLNRSRVRKGYKTGVRISTGIKEAQVSGQVTQDNSV